MTPTDSEIITECFELMTDGEDIVKDYFTVSVKHRDGSEAQIHLTKAAAYELRALLDGVPELDGDNW